MTRQRRLDGVANAQCTNTFKLNNEILMMIIIIVMMSDNNDINMVASFYDTIDLIYAKHKIIYACVHNNVL